MRKKTVIILSAVLVLVLVISGITLALLAPEKIPMSVCDVISCGDAKMLNNATNNFTNAIDGNNSTKWMAGGSSLAQDWILLDLNAWYDIDRIEIKQTPDSNKPFAIFGSDSLNDLDNLTSADTTDNRNSGCKLWYEKVGDSGAAPTIERSLEIEADSSSFAGGADAFKTVRYLKVFKGNSITELEVYGARDENIDVEDARIPLTADSIISGSVSGASYSVDGYFTTSTTTISGENSILLDLKGYYSIAAIRVWTHYGAAETVKVYAGNDIDNLLFAGNCVIKSGNLSPYYATLSLAGNNPKMPVRYVKIKNPTANGVSIKEVCLFGKFDREVVFKDVTFDPKNGESVNVVQVESGTAIGKKLPETEPVNGTKGFSGWYYDNNGTETLLNASTVINENTTVYAKWTNSIPVTADMISSSYDKTATDHAGKLFDDNIETQWYKWNENELTVDLEAYYDVSAIKFYSYSINTNCIISVGETLDNMTAVVDYTRPDTDKTRHWVTQPANNSRVRFIQISKQNGGAISELKLYGEKVGEVPKYTVRFATGTDTTVANQVVLKDAYVTLPEGLQKINYRLVGWYTDADYKTPFSATLPVTSDMTLYAKWVDIWTPETYSITFDSKGGSPVTPMVDIVAGSAPALPSSSRGGYIFSGWYKDANCTNYFSSGSPVSENLTLYAKWEPIATADSKIPLSAENIISNFSLYQSSGALVKNNMKNLLDDDIATNWNVWGETECIIDLGADYRISYASVYLTKCNFKLSISRTPDNFKEVYSSTDNAYINGWKQCDMVAVGRYLKLSRDNGITINELTLYGKQVPADGYSLNPVTNLSSEMISGDDPYVQLNWTTPSIDGFDGTADEYDIRYSTSLINAGNFESAQKLEADDFIDGDEGIPIPRKAGVPQNVKIYGLRGSTTYYFAIRTKTDWLKLDYSAISNVTNLTTAPDTIAPGKIEDFNITLCGSKAAELQLTAVGDNHFAVTDGDKSTIKHRGTATRYEIRYSTNPITEENWDTCTLAPDIFTPQKAGTVMTEVLKGLTPSTGYYVAIRAIDSTGNKSEISNVATFKTYDNDLIPPSAVSNLTAELEGGDVKLSWLTPGNNGMQGKAYSYDFRISEAPIDAGNFFSARRILTDVKPDAPSLTQEAKITGLEKGKYYYIALISYDLDENVSAISNVFRIAIGERISLNPTDNIIPEFPNGTYNCFLDEQEKSGDPAYAPNGFNPATKWAISSYNLVEIYEQSVVIDLGAEYDITGVYYFDGAGDGTVTFSLGQPFSDEWYSGAYTSRLSDYNIWKSFNPKCKSRYIRIQTDILNGWPTEIMVYGIKTGRSDYVSTKKADNVSTTMDQSIGINCFIDDPFDMTCVAGNIRDYQNWRWNSGNPSLYPNNLYAFNPSLAGGGWNFDQYYKNFADSGIRIMSDIKDGFQYFFGWEKGGEKPVYYNPKSTDINDYIEHAKAAQQPASYMSHADAMYQYVARYGSVEVPLENLKTASNQKKLTGLNYITSIEDWNEQDATWNGRGAYFLPYEYAAMCSADYDGHCKTLGTTVGAKNADPNIRFVMAGLAGMKVEYVRAMNFWFKYNRKDGQFAADALNFHYYSNSGGSEQDQTSETTGTCIESSDVIQKLNAITSYRDKYLPNLSITISEYGWDTNEQSTQGIVRYGALNVEEIQAQWLLRGFLINYSLGVEETQMYMLRDVNGDSSIKYNSSGIITRPPEKKNEVQSRKTAWYYIFAMKNALKGYTFDTRIKNSDKDIWILRFKNAAGEYAYAAWSGTMTDRRLPDIELKLDGGNVYTMIEMKKDEETNKITTTGLYTPIVTENGKYTIDYLTECPVFFVEGERTVPALPEFGSKADIRYEVIDDEYAEITWDPAETDSEILYYTIFLNDEKYTAVSGKDCKLTIPFGEKSAYQVKIYAGDIYGQESEKPLKASKTIDFTKPAKPKNIKVLMTGRTEVALSFDEAVDNNKMQGNLTYRLYDAKGKVIDEQKATHLKASDLKPDTTYKFTITAVDAGGNESLHSTAIEVTTVKYSIPVWLLIILAFSGLILLALITLAILIFISRKRGVNLPIVNKLCKLILPKSLYNQILPQKAVADGEIGSNEAVAEEVSGKTE